MKVSIIIPVYNSSSYILRCIESVSNQTYNNIECIIIDDCGTDESITIAERFIQNTSNSVEFKIIHHQYNQGQSGARNTGINVATGEYIFFLDSDDAITSDCIEKLTDLALKYPKAEIIQANTVTGMKGLMPYQFKCVAPEYCDDKRMIEELLLSTTSTMACNRLLKKNFLVENALYFPVGIVMEDTYWNYFVTKKVNACAFTNDRTYLYYRNESSTVNNMSKMMRRKRIHGILSGSNAFYKDIKKEGSSTKYQRLYLLSNMVICMSKLSSSPMISVWMSFWKLTNNIFIFHPIIKPTLYSTLLYLSMMPPLCFLCHFNGWSWRLNHYIVSKI